MTGTSIPSQPASDQGQKQASRNGLITFAGTMMVIVGVWHVIVGVTALVNGKIYVNAASTIYSFDLTGWGWVHLLAGSSSRRRHRGPARSDVGVG